MRNSTGAVVQFLYGEDGMDGTAIESQRVEHLRMDARRLRVRTPWLHALRPALLLRVCCWPSSPLVVRAAVPEELAMHGPAKLQGMCAAFTTFFSLAVTPCQT